MVDDDSALRSDTVLDAASDTLERVDCGFGPRAALLRRRRDLKHRAAAMIRAPRTTPAIRAVKVPGLVENHSSGRIVTIAPTLEAVQHLLLPFG